MRLHYGEEIKEKIYKLFPLLKRRPVNREIQIELAQEKLRVAFEKSSKGQGKESKIELKEGYQVLMRMPHQSIALEKQISNFFYLYEGSFLIVQKVGNNAFILTKINEPNVVHGTYNCYSLKIFIRLPFSLSLTFSP